MNHKTKQNKTKNPSADTCSTLKARSINIGYQHGHSQTTATHTKKKQTWQQMACCAIYTQNTKIKWQVRLGRERHRDWQTCYLLYWTGVPLPWQPAALDWYLEQRLELLQRIWCSVHIWGQLIWHYNQLLLCSLHTELAIPCLGHSGWHLSHQRQNLSQSARLTSSFVHPDRCFCCSVQCQACRRLK